MPPRQQSDIKDAAVTATLETIRNRVSAFGVAEEVINRQGGLGKGVSDRIVLQLPGVENPGRVKDLIRSQAKLEWKELTYPPGQSGPFDAPASREALAAMYPGGALPPDTEAYPQPLGQVGTDGQEIMRWWPLKKVSVVSGNDLRRAYQGESGKGAVHPQLTSRPQSFPIFTTSHLQQIAARRDQEGALPDPGGSSEVIMARW
jgi:preprotein translocase subunit SecD